MPYIEVPLLSVLFNSGVLSLHEYGNKCALTHVPHTHYHINTCTSGVLSNSLSKKGKKVKKERSALLYLPISVIQIILPGHS